MGSRRFTRIIQRAYARQYGTVEPGEITYSPYGYPSRLYPLLDVLKSNWVQLSCLVTVLLLITATVYYYNLLVTTDQDVLSAWGKVNALLQRRNDISINLSKAVLDYSKHELGVFTAVTELRSFLAKESVDDPELKQLLQELGQPKATAPEKAAGKTAVKPGDTTVAPDPSSPLTRLLAVAEQYPDLKLSVTFQSLMGALIDIEKDLAEQRINYNDMVNIYTTNVKKFPINAFAAIFKFKDKQYFKATDEAKKLKPIEY